jgi:hypothetical protein
MGLFLQRKIKRLQKDLLELIVQKNHNLLFLK